MDLSVTNGGKNVNTFDYSQVEGFSAGRRHVANSQATMSANSYTNVFPKVINPGQVLRSVVLIDVPVGEQLDTVELHDSILTDSTSVSVK